MTWLTRDDLGAAGRTATGLLLVSPDGASALPLTAHDRELTGAALRAAGVGPGDRVAVALAEPAGALWAEAAAGVAGAAASVGPRGRMRLHHLLTTLRATTLVATPTGAMDFLARLHLEFLLDPLDLGLRHIVVTGEIASRGTLGHLASEFDAQVTEVFAGPFTGGALAWRRAEEEPFAPLAEGVLGLGALDKDEAVERGPGEVVVTVPEAGVVRTGYVVRDVAPVHTVGDHLLVRGVWLSLGRLDRALAKIDGVSAWTLSVSRQGTLDLATLAVAFNRDSLVRNPMWKARIEQAVQAVTPVKVAVEVAPEVVETRAPGAVNDLRGQHLGRDRALVNL
ncbi:hypothetical protein [Thermoactinospora rubra]|uniref:hypothetical protein n=1 Tax=Thermoactinospora rubra TaxID=1088767 RepID=UPI000A1047BC|nr:hypothetical protein [Thermoactinospora rubra]